MRRPSRLPALAALFLVTAGVNVASAQTLIVRNGVAASPVELFINGSRTLTMSVGPDGSVAIPLAISTALNNS